MKPDPQTPLSDREKKTFPHPSPTEFVQEIRELLEKGMAFTPFVGSGISSQSGILMSSAFTNYISYCVWLVLGSPKDDETPSSQRTFWDLMRNGWPPYPREDDIEVLRGYFFQWFNSYAKRNAHKITSDSKEKFLIEKISPEKGVSLSSFNFEITRPLVPNILRSSQIWNSEEILAERKRLHSISNRPIDPNLSHTSLSYITEVGVRSLSHWTDTIEFLASTRVDHRLNKMLYLEEPDSSIIDSFNQHITRGKHPNLIHNLLSRLTRSLRSHIILTTNFDTLLEQAFHAQKESLHTIPVSSKGNLPAYATVRAQNCLIKLHGDLLETRADSSINSPPQQIDRTRFFQYLRGPEHPHSLAPINFVQSHMMVLGYSASDARCVQLIKYVLDVDPEFKVFWVCHTEQDQQKISLLFGDYNQKKGRIQTVVTDRTDLLLWELYQSINLSLPGGGYNFKFTHHVPPLYEASLRLNSSDKTSKKEYERRRTKLFQKVRSITQNFVLTIDYKSGLAGPCRDLFQDFVSEGMNALWFELEDHRNPIAFLWETFGAIGLRRGASKSGSANFLPSEIIDLFESGSQIPPRKDWSSLLDAFDRRIDLFIDRFGIEPSNWIIFLYGRNGPGGCTGWETRYWSQEEHDLFCEILTRLAKHKFRLVYMPFGKLRSERNAAKAADVLKRLEDHKNILRIRNGESSLEPPPDDSPCPVAVEEVYDCQDRFSKLPSYLLPTPTGKRFSFWLSGSATPSPTPSYQNILDSVFDDFLKIKDPNFNEMLRSTRMLWLYGLTLFRQSRHSAAMISEAVFPCPWKFNEIKQDNDRTRYRRIFQGTPYEKDEFYCKDPKDADKEGWLIWLGKKGLFLKKPGGFSWKFRDTRLAIQYILEEAHTVVLGPNPFLDPEKRNDWLIGPGVRLQTLKPRIHYWIADWYLKAFHSSGHSNPLVECIYHCARCILLSPSYSPPSLTNSDGCIDSARIQLAWAAVCLMRRAVRNGKSCFQFWCPGLDVKAILMDEIAPLHQAAQNLKKKCSSSNLADTLVKSLEPGGWLDLEIQELRETVIAEGFSHRSKPTPTLSSHFSPLQKRTHSTSGSSDHWKPDKWLETIFQKLGELLNIDSGKDQPRSSKDYHRIIRDARFAWIMNWDKKGANPQELMDLAWSLSSLTYDILRPAKLIFHLDNLYPEIASGLNTSSSSSSTPSYTDRHDPRRWLLICSIIYHSLQLCRLIPLDFERQECELRIRLLSTYGLALGCLGRSSEANRRFNEAHALALTRSTDDLPLQLARIHLRRAEMSIYCFHSEYSDYLKNRQTGGSSSKESDKSDSFDSRSCFAHLDDAWAAIERGETSLSGLNQSSFWWYRVAVTKLSCLAALARACSEDKEVVPNASFPMRRRQHLPTVIEELLGEALFSAEGDRFRELRAVDYALRASRIPQQEKKDAPSEASDENSFLISNLKDLREKKIVHRHRLYSHLNKVLSDKNAENSHLDEYLEALQIAYQLKTT